MRRFESLKEAMQLAGGCTLNILPRDSVYRDAAYSEIDESFPAFRRFLRILSLARYRREGNDCENFAELYRVFMQMRYAKGFEADPTGICDYPLRGDLNDWHAINFRICGNNVYFIEPQRERKPIVNLDQQELRHLRYRIL